jgi:hypothetical protein
LSINDIATVGNSFGLGETIDNYCLVAWNGNATETKWNGLTNNRIFAQFSSVTGNPVTAVKFVSYGGCYQTSIHAT